jgi:hypothetical protein
MSATKSTRTTIHRSFVRMTALTVVIAMPVLGMSGIASAKTKATKGSAAWCAKHAKRAVCSTAAGGGSGSGGSTGTAPAITVTASPNPLVETGQSEVHAIIQVQTSPSFAGDAVNIDSSQLSASCNGGIEFENLQSGSTVDAPHTSRNQIDAILDDDGNATVVVDGVDCAPGTSVIEADLEVAPFITALTTLVVLPPAVTPEGVTGYPALSGVSQEIETGDTSASGDSNIYAVFYVETSPVYAEQTVEINSAQLDSRCIEGWRWEPGNALGVGLGAGYSDPVFSPLTTIPSTILDDDGNAVFVFKGISCASGPSEVIADVMAGTHPTYTTTFTVNPPTAGSTGSPST